MINAENNPETWLMGNTSSAASILLYSTIILQISKKAMGRIVEMRRG
jgi:hypothetical protein